jgi:hypothetical protein
MPEFFPSTKTPPISVLARLAKLSKPKFFSFFSSFSFVAVKISSRLILLCPIALKKSLGVSYFKLSVSLATSEGVKDNFNFLIFFSQISLPASIISSSSLFSHFLIAVFALWVAANLIQFLLGC